MRGGCAPRAPGEDALGRRASERIREAERSAALGALPLLEGGAGGRLIPPADIRTPFPGREGSGGWAAPSVLH